MAKITDPDLLTYLVNGSPSTQNIQINTSTKTIKLVAGGNLVALDGVTGQCLYSKLKEIIRADADLIKYPLPVNEMIHDESLELINGWDFYDTTSLKMVRDCGIAMVSTAGVPIKMFACFVTLGAVLSGAPYYTLDSATNAATSSFTHIKIGGTYCINELVQIYSDPNGDGSTADGYDRRAYAKVFLREAGYTYDESTNTDIGYPALTYKKYNFPITHAVDAGVVDSDATVDSAAPYTGLALQWYATGQSRSLGSNGPYNFHVIITGNGATAAQAYTWIQRQLRKTSDIDAGAGNRTGAVTPSLAFMDGTTLKTRYQTGSGGVHVDNLSAASYNDIAEADDTQASRTYPYTGAITLDFDSFLVADSGPAIFRIFDAASYGTSGATLLTNAAGANLSGSVTGASLTFSFNGTFPTNAVGVAVGKDNAKIAIAAFTIERSTANKATFVAGKERWYQNA